MQLIMMGTGPFAVPTLERLFGSRHEVLALVTRPPRKLHGKTQADVNPMRELAGGRGTPNPRAREHQHAGRAVILACYRPDLFVVCDYGQILCPKRWKWPGWAGSTCTLRCCRNIAARRRSIGRSTKARPRPA